MAAKAGLLCFRQIPGLNEPPHGDEADNFGGFVERPKAGPQAFTLRQRRRRRALALPGWKRGENDRDAADNLEEKVKRSTEVLIASALIWAAIFVMGMDLRGIIRDRESRYVSALDVQIQYLDADTLRLEKLYAAYVAKTKEVFGYEQG